MKKQFFAAAMILALGAGVTACSSDDLNVKQGTENLQRATTYMSISFSLPNADTRAADDGQDKPAPDFNRVGLWEGQDKIEKVLVYVFKNATGAFEKKVTFTNAQLAITKNANGESIVKPQQAFKVDPDAKDVFVVLNPKGTVETTLDAATTKSAFETAYDAQLTGLSKPTTRTSQYTTGDETRAGEVASTIAASGSTPAQDVILMTGDAHENVAIADNVTAAQALAGQNTAKITVKRAVARVFVTSKETEYTINGDDPETDAVETNFALAKISDLTYVVAQGDANVFVRQHAHATDVTAAYTSPAFDKNLTVTGDYWDATVMADYSTIGANFDYSGLWKNTNGAAPKAPGVAVGQISTYTSTTATGQDQFDEIKSKLGTGEFILPTTHKFVAGDRANSGYQLGNTPYILVRGKVTPQKFVKADGTWSTATDVSNLTGSEDWFVGTNGVFYADKTCVQDPAKKGVTGQEAKMYKGGKVLYTLFVNPDDIQKAINSPVTRNNIYNVHITGVSKLGENWNPLVPNPNTPSPTDPNPSNPNNPDDRPGKGDNPYEPVTPPVKPIDPLSNKETWMAVNVTIIPWQVHTYTVTL